MSDDIQISKRLTKLLSFFPDVFKDKPNFSALMKAIAVSDSDLEDLFLSVKKQLFVETANGSFLDKLGSNVGITRPPLIGMVDNDFREFIKLQTYFPKQVKSLLFRLMDLFYGVDTIKANIRSTASAPFFVIDNATLIIRVDGEKEATVTLEASSFNNPASVSAEELVAQISLQLPEGIFATTYYNAVDKMSFVEIYTDTYGPTGSVEILGGTANRFLKFPAVSRNGSSAFTKYRLEKTPSTVSFIWAGGDNPLFSDLMIGDHVILTGAPFLPENIGSFEIEKIEDSSVAAEIIECTSAVYISDYTVRYNAIYTGAAVPGDEVIVSGFLNDINNGLFEILSVGPTYLDLQVPRVDDSEDEENVEAYIDFIPSSSKISFTNFNGTTQSEFSISSIDDVLFFRATKKKLESVRRSTTIWEVNPNEIIITVPATPVIVRRSLKGSSHLQGTSALIGKTFFSSVEVVNPEYFPDVNGRFYIQKQNGTLLIDQAYKYAIKVGDTLQGVSPVVKPVGEKLRLGPGPLYVESGTNLIRVTSPDPHGLSSGETVHVKNFDSLHGIPAENINGIRTATEIINSVSFYISADSSATSSGSNFPSLDKGEIYTSRGSKVILTNVQQNTGYVGAYVYDEKNSQYTISQTQTTVKQDISQGSFGDSIKVHNSAVFPESSGEIIFSYGKNDEEGPVRFIAKPGQGTLFIDPSYRFTKDHEHGSPINLIRYKYATSPNERGDGYAPFVVDTITPRAKLMDLLKEAKAAGITIKFIIVLPENVYNAYNLYEFQ